MLSPKQYAERHGVSTRTVFRWIKSGRIKVDRISARTIRINTAENETPEPTPPQPVTYPGVYFVRGGGFVKIGYGTCVRSRVGNLQTSSPVPLEASGYIPAASAREAQELESDLHARFAADRAHGEWFRETPELLACIEERCQPWPWQAKR